MIVFALSQEAPKLDVSVPLAPSILMPQLCKVFIQHGRGTCPSRISYHTDIPVPRSTADRLRDYPTYTREAHNTKQQFPHILLLAHFATSEMVATTYPEPTFRTTKCIAAGSPPPRETTHVHAAHAASAAVGA
ncbi:hypothetical protein NDA11_004293 [Ustilago hordei]|uniref:Uncharacterized protein n=1 Tax=Ustilago hordei TaxID=120017 RepID=I2G126_USTHO|nr:hypothetical protein NDA10_005697 [Ustilago hordei]KAJ1581152.1 hypothetical protein NDA15_005386 [Ustilago hordei]KAJ1582819.1 hypothetical protein NDA12_003724 [Ustilago hordei]KAJ1588697.1 hypothetical protein NDA11_004293 [Ustilago hordei]KAJ1599804.1 hypothetical protein NDA14_002770 [Ustilago hordei]